MKKTTSSIATTLLVLLLSTACTHTAPIRNASGQKLILEIDQRTTVSINGSKQKIYVAAVRHDNPIILWLDGGPGGSELGWVRTYLGPLHEHATIVCWDQRGVGASYMAAKKGLAVEDFVQDIIALTEYLT